MKNWTKEQLEAINCEGTNILVSAGAGSGKTSVLTERVIRKINSGIKINELLVLTFTRAAAEEMKKRIQERLIDNPKQFDLLPTA
ncbi:MAG: UvrD-helicase domain-containing protein, partial [Bacilli bacterium]